MTGLLELVLDACDAARPGTTAALRGWVSDLDRVAVLWHEAWLAWLQQTLVRVYCGTVCLVGNGLLCLIFN